MPLHNGTEVGARSPAGARMDAVLFLLSMLGPGTGFAQAPFYTDDTAVTAPGTLHIEVFDEIDGLQSMHYPDLRQNTVNLKMNAGLPHGIELDVDVPYIAIDRSSVSPSSRGIGDTNLGVKWNLRVPSANSRLRGFAVRSYVEFPTADSRQDLGAGVT